MQAVHAYGMDHEPADVQIFKTKDYERFQVLTGNRGIKLSNLERLKRSIKEMDMLDLNPVITTPRKIGERYVLAIVDGGHRYTENKGRKVDVHYVIGKNLNTKAMELLNTASQKWAIADYLNLFLTAKDTPEVVRAHYQKVKDYTEEFDLTIANAIALLSVSNRRNSEKLLKSFRAPIDAFHAGTFEVIDEELSREFIEKAMLVRRYLADESMWGQRPLIASLWRLFANDLLNDLLTKLDMYGSKFNDGQGARIQRKPNIQGYLEQYGQILVIGSNSKVMVIK